MIAPLAALAADLLVALHAAFLAFVLAGIVVVSRRPSLWPAHVACATWGLTIELTRFTCPLTTAEKWLRARAGQTPYDGGFFEEYIVSLVLPEALPRPVQTTLVVAILSLTLAGYGRLVRQGRIPVRPRARLVMAVDRESEDGQTPEEPARLSA